MIRVDGDVFRLAEIAEDEAITGSVGDGLAGEVALRGEPLDARVAVVADIEDVVGINSNTFGIVELYGITAIVVAVDAAQGISA